PLHYAAAGAYLKVARRLLKMKKYDVNARTKEGWTPLHIAVIQKVRALVELLLVNGAKLNATDNYGWTPLHLAVKNNVEILNILLEGNYIIKRVDCDGCTPLIGAAAAGSTAAVEILLDHG
ncbi:ankyrin, partial [Lepidopterella palustris CBS 459.81]